jgi:hypothetical protein
MINVRIRHELEADALPLGQMPFDPLMIRAGEQILEALLRWGIYLGPEYETVDGGIGDSRRLSGQFVADTEAGEAYFEIIVHDSEGDA